MKMIDKVRSDPSILRNYSTPPIDLQRAAIDADPSSIRYINNPRPEIQELAVRKGSLMVYKLINAPSRLAKMALLNIMPKYIAAIGTEDEDLVELAIRKEPSVVVKLRNLPYRLQALAIELANRPQDFIGQIDNIHPDLVIDHLSKRPDDYQKFNRIPVQAEIKIIDDIQLSQKLVTVFNNMRNPSIVCQNYFLRKLFAITDHSFNFSLLPWWRNLSKYIDREFKMEMIARVASEIEMFTQQAQKRFYEILSNEPDLITALTIMR